MSIDSTKKVKICVICSYLPHYIIEPGNGKSSFNVQKFKFSSSFFFILLLVTLQTYIWQKNWELLTDLLKVKNDMFLTDNGHTKKTYIQCKYPPMNIHWVLLMATWIRLIAPYRYTLKRGAKLWASLGFCSVSWEIFSLSHILVYLGYF